MDTTISNTEISIDKLENVSQFNNDILIGEKLIEATGLCKSYHGRQVVKLPFRW